MVYILIFHIFESVNSLFFFKSMNKVLYYYYYLLKISISISNNNNSNNNNNNNDLEVVHPQSDSSSTWFLIELEFGNVGF